MTHQFRAVLSVAFLATFATAAEPAKAPDPKGVEFFESKIRPALVRHCYQCHSAEALKGNKLRGGLLLDTKAGWVKGGDNGPSIVPGKPAESLLLKSLKHDGDIHMPPKGKLPADTIADFEKWIAMGAPDPRDGKAASQRVIDIAAGKKYWAFQPLGEIKVPGSKFKGENAIDAFVFSKLEKAGLAPVAEAEKRVLIRRVYFDLIGLPPTPEQVAKFLADKDANAYEKVVDELLASPHFGERWARHWMDPARYAESHGFEHDYNRPHAYHYRDFLTRAFNADMPYDRFLKWQLAGDEFAPNDPEALAATGFLGAGVFPTQITNREADRIRYDAMDDMLATTGHAMLGLTVGCARCHDHKFDPIPTKDYYRMLAAFTTTVRSEVEVNLSSPKEKAAFDEWEAARKPLADDLKKYEDTELPKALDRWLTTDGDKSEAIGKIADTRAATALRSLLAKKQTFDKLPKAQKDAVTKWFGPQDARWKALTAALASWDAKKPPANKVIIQATTEGRKPMRHHTADGAIPDFYPTTFFLKRGDVLQKDGEAQLGFAQVLVKDASAEGKWRMPKPAESGSSFRRASLANWIVDTESGAGALAARVIANRLWHHHFGRGIVSTVNDFGVQGDPPTHPELLEWLANDLVKNGWQLKRVHKQMVMSRTYRLSGATTPEALKADPDNKLLWHRPMRRLEAEAIRDALLAVSGVLDAKLFGPGTLDQGMKRRSIYFTVKRSELIPFLQVFDWPDTMTSAAARPNTVVAPQALVFLNNPHVRSWANAFASRIQADAKTPEAMVGRAYQLAFGRDPKAAETETGLAFLKVRSTATSPDKALQEYALAVMSLNEFIYVE